MRNLTLATFIALGLSACNADGPDELRAKASTAMAQNDLRTAEIHLKNLLQQENKDVESRRQLAQIYISRGNWASAEKELRRALEYGLSSDQVAAQLMEAMTYTSEPDAILAEAKELATTNAPVQASLNYFTALAHDRLGDRPLAIAVMEKAIELNPELIKAKVALYKMQAQASDSALQESVAKLTVLQKEHPEDVNVLLATGDLLLSAEKADAARDAFDRAYELSPDSLETLMRMAALRIGQSEFEEAAPFVEKSLKMAPRSPMVLTQKAQIDYSKGDFGPSLDAASAALVPMPDFVPALAVAAASALATGSLERAETYANHLRTLAPESLDGYRLLATVLFQKNQPDRVLNLIGPLLDRGLQDPALLTLAGQAAMKLNNPAEASQYLNRAVTFEPTDPSKRIYLAMAKLSAGDDIGGIGDLEAASEMTSESASADYTLIEQLIRRKEFDKANSAIATLEKKQPGKPQNRYLSGLVALAQNDLSSAKSAFEQAIEIDGLFYPAIANLASIDLRQGNKEQAAGRFETLLEKQPENENALLALARLYNAQPEQREKAKTLIQTAIKANPSGVRPVLMLVASQVQDDNTDAAEQTLRDALQRTPDQPNLMEALAKVQQIAGKSDLALATIDKVSSLRPDDPRVQFRLATLRQELGDFRGALNGFKAVQKMAPQAVEPRVRATLAYAKMGNLRDAMSSARALQTDIPNVAAGWLLEAELHRNNNEWDKAAKAYEKGMSLEPEKQAIYLKLDGVWRRSGQVEKADAKLAERLKEQPDNAGLQRYAGDIAASREEFQVAIKHYEKAVAAAPRDPVAWNNLAWTQHKAGDSKALQSGEKALSLSNNAAFSMDTMADILIDNNQPERAVKMQREAVSKSPGTSSYQLHLARILIKTGDTEGAQTTIDALISKFPDTPDAIEARKLRDSL